MINIEDNCFHNSGDSIEQLADALRESGSALIPWTDGETMYTTLLTINTPVYGQNHLGLKTGYLYVAIMRKGAFGFTRQRAADLDKKYVMEKLDINSGQTGELFAHFLNQLIAELDLGKGK